MGASCITSSDLLSSPAFRPPPFRPPSLPSPTAGAACSASSRRRYFPGHLFRRWHHRRGSPSTGIRRSSSGLPWQPAARRRRRVWSRRRRPLPSVAAEVSRPVYRSRWSEDFSAVWCRRCCGRPMSCSAAAEVMSRSSSSSRRHVLPWRRLSCRLLLMSCRRRVPPLRRQRHGNKTFRVIFTGIFAWLPALRTGVYTSSCSHG